MNQPPYIPTTLDAFQAWLLNFSTLLTAAPATYGLVAGDAVIVAAQYTAWNAAYLLGTNPATRTTPNVAAMNGARVTATGVVRPYAQSISRNMAVDDADKLSIGVNLPNNAPVPIPPITDVPALIIQPSAPGQVVIAYRQGSAPTSRAKPFGAVALELFRSAGVAFATSPDQCTFIDSLAKTPQVVLNTPANAGDKLTFFARWTTRSGPQGKAQKGPWSLAYNVVAS
ncbi:MAG: hypothetical protein ABMA26_22685 [Limisphaerales bacterium]